MGAPPTRAAAGRSAPRGCRRSGTARTRYGPGHGACRYPARGKRARPPPSGTRRTRGTPPSSADLLVAVVAQQVELRGADDPDHDDERDRAGGGVAEVVLHERLLVDPHHDGLG